MEVRNDLIEAHASVDWPLSQLVGLHERFDEWLRSSVQIEIREIPGADNFNPLVAVEKELLPIAFSVEVGAYINCIRSALDILAMALVRRNGLKLKEEQVFFPISRSEAEFRGPKNVRLLDALLPTDRAIIESLKPYDGGNPALAALHRLDIVRKHRQLLDVAIRPVHMSLKGRLKPGDFEPLATGSIQAGSETILGLLRKGVNPESIRSTFYIAMNEKGYVARKPVGAALAHLGDVVSAIIGKFDN